VRRVLVVAALALAAVLAGPTVAAAQEREEPPVTPEVPVGDIVPKPNSGEEPRDAGDRGGALQLTVLALVVGAIGYGGWRLAVRIRDADRQRGAPPA